MARYRFGEFTLSPQRRLLIREGREVPIIPRYFDLLLLLIERRREAVHRREIFDRVWGDVAVSDSALSQAVRTIRRTLGDDIQEPRFIRTVSRHGYQFVFPDVVEENEEDEAAAAAPTGSAGPARPARHMTSGLMRGAAGGAVAGAAAGSIGGFILAAAPGSTAPVAIAPVLAVIAAVAGAAGGAGVGAGLAFADAAPRAHRMLALTAAAAAGGGLVGTAVQWLTRWGLAALVGLDLDVGGALEGILVGGSAGLGFSIATRNKKEEAPEEESLNVAMTVALLCGMAGLALTLAGRPLVGGTIHAIADAAEGSRATLEPLGRLIGEPDFGPVSRAIAGIGECAVFGFGLAYGLMRRQHS